MVTRGVVRHWGERKEGRKGEEEDGSMFTLDKY